MAARLLWEQSFSGWLARDSYGTRKSRAQARLRKFRELTPSSQLPGGGFGKLRLLLSRAKHTHGGQSWEHFQANSKQSLELSLALGRENPICLHLTPSGRGVGTSEASGFIFPHFPERPKVFLEMSPFIFYSDFLL